MSSNKRFEDLSELQKDRILAITKGDESFAKEIMSMDSIDLMLHMRERRKDLSINEVKSFALEILQIRLGGEHDKRH